MSRRSRFVLALAALALATPTALASGAQPASAATVPSGFTDTRVAGSITAPTDVVDLPDGRLLVTGQGGTLTVIGANGSKVAAPALSLSVCTGSEQGLLGVERDPNFVNNGYIYVYYGYPTSGTCHNRVSRFTMTGDAAGSELVLIDNIISDRGNHEGGDLLFGKDGTLYISSGDDGELQQTGGPRNFSQELDDLRGKILRINPDGTIPVSNPFASGPTTADCSTGRQPGKQCRQIYAIGFRNPWRMALDPNSATTRIFVNDVGESTSEEIDELAPGANYGWPVREGNCAIGSVTNCGDPGPNYVNPVHAYFHGSGCGAVTGGGFVPDGVWPSKYAGGYIYGDSNCGNLFALLPDGNGGWTSETFGTGAGVISSMRMMNQGGAWALYYTSYDNGGEVRKIVATTAGGITGPSAFHPLTPVRVLDTRSGVGYTGPKPAAGETVNVQITGATSGVPADAKAVALNVTGTESNAAGFITLWPAGEVRPITSTINFSSRNDTVANAAVMRLNTSGQVSLYTQNGAHLVVDVTGYWTETATSSAGRYVPLDNPARLLDTRDGNGGPKRLIDAEETIDVQVTGRGGLPTSGISAVALVVTVTNTARSGFVTAWPTGLPKPLASTVNPVGANDIRSNLVLLPVGTDGKVSLFTLQPTHLVMDVAGYFTDGTAQLASTGLLVAVSPRRLLDTREAGAPFGRLNAGDVGVVDYSAAVAPSNAIALIHNLTVDGTAFAGFLTAFPNGNTLPTASNVNWNGPNQIRAALAISSLKNGGRVSYYPNVGTDLVIDQQGWFIP